VRTWEALEPLDVDGFLVTNLTNVRYLTGFTGSAGAALLLRERGYFLTDFRYKEQSKAEIHAFETVIGEDTPDCLRRAELLAVPARIAFEADHLSVHSWQRQKEDFPDIEWVQSSMVLEKIAAIKEDEEIANIRRAAQIADRVYGEILPLISPDRTENDISAEISYSAKRLGSEVDPFPPIVASGARSALPHGVSSNKPISTGDLVVLDFGATVEGYAADMTRTVVVGEPTEEQSRIYDIVLEAQSSAIEAAHAGMKCSQLDAVAREYITEAGYGEFFGHSLGHGLGLEVHTYPRLSKQNHDLLKAQMVVTIEPGIYIPGVGGVRIEDDVVIAADGCTNLTGSPKELLHVG